MKKAVLAIVVFLTLIFLFIYSQQVVDTGYVVEVLPAEAGSDREAPEEPRIYLISLEELAPGAADGKSREELVALLRERVEQQVGVGNIYDIPWPNRLIGTEFEVGDRVKIYYDGRMAASAPGQVDGTKLILKMDE